VGSSKSGIQVGGIILKIGVNWVPMVHACILPTWGQRSGGLQFEASLGKFFAIPYLKKKKKKISAKTGLVEWLKWYCACQASVKPCVQTPVLPTLQMLDLETILRQLCFALKKKPENTYTHFSYILAFYRFHTLKKK
jgi:hypothetical protein